MTPNNIPRIPRDYKNVTPGLYGQRKRKALQRKRMAGIALALILVAVVIL